MRQSAVGVSGLFCLLLSMHAVGKSIGEPGLTLRPGDAGTGCANCHGASPSVVSVSIHGSSALLPGATARYGLTVAGITNPAAKVGFTAAMTKNAAQQPVFGLVAGEPTRLTDNGTEIVQTDQSLPLKLPVDGSSTHVFDISMPAHATLGETFTIYAVGDAGKNATQVGWAHAANFVLTVAPPAPTALDADQAGAGTTQIPLAWSGSQGEHFRVLYRTGSYPDSALDPDATLVYEGAATSAIATGLDPGTTYFFAAYGKAPSADFYSSTAATDTAQTVPLGTPRFVDAVRGSIVGNDCSDSDSPCRTITHAMGQADPGDPIHVAPGVYDVQRGEVFPIAIQSGVRLRATATPQLTVIDGAGDAQAQGLIVSSGNTSLYTRIEGFTLRNGLHAATAGEPALGGAIRIELGNEGLLTLSRNLFAYNEARGFDADGSPGQTGGLARGGAVGVLDAVVLLENNLFVGNIARGGNGLSHPDQPLDGSENGGDASGGALHIASAGSSLVVNTSFHGNHAIGGNGGLASNGSGEAGYGIGGATAVTGDPDAALANNVFSHNASRTGTGTASDVSRAGALNAPLAAAIDNNLFFANLVDGAPGVDDDLGGAALLADPLFHAAPTNLRLRLSSTALGAGLAGPEPALDFDGHARPMPPAIGAFEGSLVRQTIRFGPAPAVSIGGSATINVSGGDSGQPVVLTSDTPSVCSVAGDAVNGLAADTCTVLANQDGDGDGDFAAATEASLSFPVLSVPTYPVSITISGAGTGRVHSAPEGIDCGSLCEAWFAEGTLVTLSATPSAGSAFAGWSGPGCAATPTCVFEIEEAITLDAAFTPLTTFAVAISGEQEVPPNGAEGSGTGLVVIDLVANTLTYDFVVVDLSGELTAAHFHGPAPRGANAPAVIDLLPQPFSGSVTYAESDEADLLDGLWYVNYHTALFPGGEIRGQLDDLGGLFGVSVAVSGSGTVTSWPAGIDCGNDCQAVFPAGSGLTLSAVSRPAYRFAGWSGDCAGLDAACHLDLSQARVATARFEPDPEAPAGIFENGFEM
jgi:hypothetical protein